MTRLTVSLSLCLAIGTVAGSVVGPAAVAGAPAAVDLVAEWDKQWDKALKDSAQDYKKLADKHQEKLEATSAYTRRFVFRYAPDDEETRKFLGYVKGTPDANGVTGWVREDVRHDQINEMVDTDDPKISKYPCDLKEVTTRVLNRFKGLAKKAIENGAAKDASPDAKWPERAARAWERVLELDDGNKDFAKDFDEAHKALKHERFENKYCSPYKFKFIQARAERKKIGERESAQVVKPTEVEPDGTMAKAGLTGGGAKSDHIVINTTHGKEVALRLAVNFEKGLNDLVEVVGIPEAAKDRCPIHKITVVKDEDEWKKLLAKGVEWKQAEIQKYIDAHFGATVVNNSEFVGHGSGEKDSEDFCMNVAAMMTVEGALPLASADVGGTQPTVEDWLKECIAYDVTQRVHGSKDTHWGAFGRYGDAVEAPPGQDKWIELAKRLVIADDDIPLSALYKKKLAQQELKGPDLVKGYAFIQFLYERDKDSAKKFVWTAIAKGTPAACGDVFGAAESADPAKAMEMIDAEYREWIVKAN